jgi:pilus assembly protein CpaB
MRPKSLALLLLALGCGLVASIGITEVMAKRNAESAGLTGETQPIFVAMTDIGLGDMLTSQMLKLEQWPKDKVPAGAISRIEDVEGRRARTKLYAGEPVLENRLLGKGASQQGATALIPKGYRVVPVKVDLVSGGSNLILPGDRVDVMVHLVKDQARDIPETVTRTILQDIKVFAVDDVLDLEKEKGANKTIAAKTISLLVTPDQAAKVTLAAQLGNINLVMRSAEDDQQMPNSQAKPSDLSGVLSRAERGKESLISETNVGEKNQSFVDFLNTMKAKTPAAAASAAAAPAEPSPALETWTMRVLKPGEVSEVQFEEERGIASAIPSGAWRMANSTNIVASSSSGAPAAKTDRKGEPATKEPAAPVTKEPPVKEPPAQQPPAKQPPPKE